MLRKYINKLNIGIVGTTNPNYDASRWLINHLEELIRNVNYLTFNVSNGLGIDDICINYLYKRYKNDNYTVVVPYAEAEGQPVICPVGIPNPNSVDTASITLKNKTLDKAIFDVSKYIVNNSDIVLIADTHDTSVAKDLVEYARSVKIPNNLPHTPLILVNPAYATVDWVRDEVGVNKETNNHILNIAFREASKTLHFIECISNGTNDHPLAEKLA